MLTFNDLSKISNTIGNSFYIYSNETFIQNYNEFLTLFRNIYPKTEIAYSYKTNYLPEICKTVNNLGGFAEVVSEMEYELALKVGVSPAKIIVNGPYKPYLALEKFLILGSIVNVDSLVEFENVKNIAKNHLDATLRIGIRCNYEFSGVSVSRFGIDVSDPAFEKLLEELKSIKNISIEIVHSHFPNRSLLTFEERAVKIIDIYKKHFQSFKPKYIDLGGGLGGKLPDMLKIQLKNDADYPDYASIIANRFRSEFLDSEFQPTLIIEPGTSLVANTLQFVCSVIEIKNIRGYFIAITSGSKVNFHPMASKINVPMQVVTNRTLDSSFYESIDISGYTCMEGDYLYTNYKGELNHGDFLIFENVGSYSIVFKPPFILPNVPIISIDGDDITILKSAEDFNYIFQTYKF
jgi:diaminopimelate decarboxylase